MLPLLGLKTGSTALYLGQNKTLKDTHRNKMDDLGQLTISLGSVYLSAKWYLEYKVVVTMEETYVEGNGSQLGLG